MATQRRRLVAPLVGAFALSTAACGRQPCETPGEADLDPQVRLDVALKTCNFTPTANIEANFQAAKKSTVMLDASGSTDFNGDDLLYSWSIVERPLRSTAEIRAPNSAQATFTPDWGGSYTVQLEVSDGELIGSTQAVIRVENQPPVANPGLDFPSPLLQAAQLDGSASTDPDGDPLTYQWTLISSPSGSVPLLQGDDTVNPTLTPDLFGTYYVELVVNDGEIDSAPAVVRIGGGVTGVAPIADAGPNQSGVIGLDTLLDGTGSSDPDGRPITYEWSVLTAPGDPPEPGAFDDVTSAQPNFRPTIEGKWVIQLVVMDEFFRSVADTVEVDVVPGTGMGGGPCIPSGCPSGTWCLADGNCSRPCGTVTKAGGDIPETHVIYLGARSGTFDFAYETFNIQDKIDVIYEGAVLFSTGCVGKNDIESITYAGNEVNVVVDVTPNCAGPGSGTAWEFNVGCP